MNAKLLILTVILLHNWAAYSQPNIVTSITPIAAIVSMLTKDQANVVALDIAGGCPHHHHAKPSDKTTIDEAQMVIYIDDNFDELVSSMLLNYKGIKVKISDFHSLDFHGNDGSINWHFWLDLENVKIMHNEIAKILVQHFPELETQVQKNLQDSTTTIDQLIQLKKDSLANLNSVVLLNDSLEHFFKSLNIKELQFFQTSNTSLKNMQELDKALSSVAVKCIILSNDQNTEPYKKYKKPVIQLNSENWEIPSAEKITSELFINEYTKMIEQLKVCMCVRALEH